MKETKSAVVWDTNIESKNIDSAIYKTKLYLYDPHIN